MDQELIKDYKKELFENINGELTEEGKVSTFVQIVGEKEGLDKPVIVHIVTGFANDEEKKFNLDEIKLLLSPKWSLLSKCPNRTPFTPSFFNCYRFNILISIYCL